MTTRPYTPPPPPEDALRFFRAKNVRLSFAWQDVYAAEHAAAFTVAKSVSESVLSTIRAELDRSLSQGLTFAEFKKRLTPRLQELGWWGEKVMRDPKTGEDVPVELGSPRRLRTIYDVNMRTARAAGQWDRAQRSKDVLPYLIYELGPSKDHRREHEDWARRPTILPIDHPFWATHYPPNGWGCKCRVRQISETEAQRRGGPSEAPEIETRPFQNRRSGIVHDVPKGIDPGFESNPGRERMRAMERALLAEPPPPPRESLPPATGPMPPARRMSASDIVLPAGQPAEYYWLQWLNRLGLAPGRPRVLVDAAGGPIVINTRFFQDRRHRNSKLFKNGRETYILLLAETLLSPDEIWDSLDGGGEKTHRRRRYYARWLLDGDGDPVETVAAVDYTKDGIRGVTMFASDRPNYLAAERLGRKAFTRTEEE